MSQILALDVALLPPSDVAQRAIELSASLPVSESQGLRLDAEHLPHITLTQQFVRVADLDEALANVEEVLRSQRRRRLMVSGGGRGDDAVWMAIERTAAIVALHERLMSVLRDLKQPDGSVAAFVGEAARAKDVLWVSGYRTKSSFAAFTPHITLGHAKEPPRIEPFEFEATTVAACHLGRFCTCRRVLRTWTLRSETAGALPMRG